MSLSTNPIYKLGKDVLEGRMPQEEALRIADSIFFKNRVNADHIYEIILHVDSLINVNHTTESYLYVLITKTSFDNDTISYELAVCNRFLALIQIQQHGYNDALDLLRANLSFYISHHQYAFQLADCYTLMGNAYMGLEDANNAIESYNDAHDILSSLQMPNEIACCLQMKGTAFEAKFLFDEALESYENALKTFTQNGYAEGVANCNLSIANLYRAHQQYNHVPERYYAARKIFEELNRPIGIAKCNFNESIYYYKIGQIEKALELLSSAQEYFEDSGDDVSAAYCYIHLAVICQITDENAPEYKRSLNDALFCLSRASEIFFKHDMIFQVGECAYNAGNTFCRLHDYDHALKEFQKAKSIYDSLHNTVNALSCQIGIGNIYEDQGQYQNALACFSKVLEYESLPPEIKWEFLYGMARNFKNTGEKQGAIKYYKDTVEIIEAIRGTIDDQMDKSSYLAKVYDVYYSIVQFCLDESDAEAAIEYVERLKSRNLAELIAHKNLLPKFALEEEKHEYQRLRFRMKALAHQLSKEENHDRSINIKEELEKAERKHDQMVLNFRTKDLQFDPDQRIIITYEDIKSLINDPDSALIELFPMQDKTVVFVISQNGAIEKNTELIFDYTIYNLYDHINELTEKYEAYKSDGSNSDKLDDWQKALDSILSELYNKLFLRIRSHLDGMRKITLIPYHGFHLLPLHAMHYEDNGKRRYIIDDYQVTFAPSAKILKYCHERRRERNGKVTIAHACPEDQNFIVCAEWETEYIQNLFSGKTQVEVIDEATKKNFIQQGKNAHILHYAGHATSSALILHDDENKKESANYNLEDIFSSLDLPEAYLATLSACETGVTKLGKTDEYIGLTSGLLHAGAATVISSLWNVNDKSTSLLMRKMYENIKNGKGKAESLRNAQLWLKNPDNKKEHEDLLKEIGGKIPTALSASDYWAAAPYYWASFVCSGME